MRKRYTIVGVVGSLLLFYFFYRQVAVAQHEKDLNECIAKFERIRIEAEKVERIELVPFRAGDQKMGYRDRNKKVVIPPEFTEARTFNQGRAVVSDRNRYRGVINTKGEMIVSPRFVGLTDYFDGVAVFQGTREDRNQNGFIDRDGHILLTFRGAWMYDFTGFKNGRAEVYVHEADMAWGFLVPLGNPVPKISGTVDCTGEVVLNWRR